MLVGSGGGHLAQLLALRAVVAGSRPQLGLLRRAGRAQTNCAEEHVAWAYSPTTRNLSST